MCRRGGGAFVKQPMHHSNLFCPWAKSFWNLSKALWFRFSNKPQDVSHDFQVFPQKKNVNSVEKLFRRNASVAALYFRNWGFVTVTAPLWIFILGSEIFWKFTLDLEQEKLLQRRLYFPCRRNLQACRHPLPFLRFLKVLLLFRWKTVSVVLKSFS